MSQLRPASQCMRFSLGRLLNPSDAQRLDVSLRVRQPIIIILAITPYLQPAPYHETLRVRILAGSTISGA